MKRILHFIPGYDFGGIETVFKNTFNMISGENLEIELLVETLANKESLQELERMGCKIYVVPKLAINNLLLYIRSVNSIFKQNKSFNIIHSYNITRTPILFLIAIYNNVNTRIYHARTNKTDGNFIKKITFRLFIILGRVLSTKLIANSKEAGDFFFRNKNYSILNNGIDTKKYIFNSDVRKRMRSKLDIQNQFVIGHIGRFTEAKNHSFIIRLFKEYLNVDKDAKLLLVGDGPLMNDVLSMVQELSISANIIFVGSVKNVEDYYQAMDYFLFPSLYEGFGNVVIEAQAAGLKILASSNVPFSTKVSPLVEFLSLNDPIQKWVDKLYLTKKYTRDNMYEHMKNSQYDIEENAKIQREIYMSLLEK